MMKVIVLGGSGLQGKAAIQDLSKVDHVKEIICADVDFSAIDEFAEHLNMNKVVKVKVDATSVESLENLYSDDVDVIINLLPKPFHEIVTRQSIKSRIPLVNCSYANVLPEDIHELANKEQVAVMPEAGLDPGIDLILCGYGVSQLDKVTEL